MPKTIQAWFRRQADRRVPTAPLIPTSKTRQLYLKSNFTHQFKKRLIAKDANWAIPPKQLRKTFATWISRQSPRPSPEHVETWMGHLSALVSRITARHYMQPYTEDELQTIATLIERFLKMTLHPDPTIRTKR